MRGHKSFFGTCIRPITEYAYPVFPDRPPARPNYLSVHLVAHLSPFYSTGKTKYADGIVALCQICVYANSASNPLIYNAVNEQFREGFKNYFRSWIECVLNINDRRDHVRIDKGRQTAAKNIRSCNMCRSNDSSDNGELCGNKSDSRGLRNNDGSTETKTETVQEISQYCGHPATSV